MKKMILLMGGAALFAAGCASNDNEATYQERYHVTEDRTGSTVVRTEERVYVRDEDRRDPDFQNNMEPRVRGKHAESLGWNTENYYRQRGYQTP